MTLLAFAAEHHAAVDMDQKAAVPAADALCSNRSISPASRAHSSKPTAHHGYSARWDRQLPDRFINPTLHTMRAVSIRLYM